LGHNIDVRPDGKGLPDGIHRWVSSRVAGRPKSQVTACDESANRAIALA
jgi:hypothetical protein